MSKKGIVFDVPPFPLGTVFLRTEFNYDMNAASDMSALRCEDPSRTVQDFAETDINEIVKRFGLTGKLPQSVRMPEFGDFEGVTDYHTALNLVIDADEAFMKFPANVRFRFDHDPARLMEFVSKEENREEAIKMGLIVPERAQEPLLVRVAGEVQPQPKEAPKSSNEPPKAA